MMAFKLKKWSRLLNAMGLLNQRLISNSIQTQTQHSFKTRTPDFHGIVEPIDNVLFDYERIGYSEIMVYKYHPHNRCKNTKLTIIHPVFVILEPLKSKSRLRNRGLFFGFSLETSRNLSIPQLCWISQSEMRINYLEQSQNSSRDIDDY